MCSLNVTILYKNKKLDSDSVLRMHHNIKEKFDEICELIKSVDSNGDAIMQTLKMRTISEKFRVNVKDDKLLR